MTAAVDRRLISAISRYPHTEPLFDRDAGPLGLKLDLVPTQPSIVATFRTMARSLSYDVSEMGLSTAIQASVLRTGFRPLPVFLTRRFDASSLYVATESSIRHPSQLAGQRIAVRSPSVADVVWAAGVLLDHFGVPLDSITWVATGEEHLPGGGLPANCERCTGTSEPDLLRAGHVAAIASPYRDQEPGLAPLISDVDAVNRALTGRFGLPTIHHAVVLRDDVAADDPQLPQRLFDLFATAKRPFLDQLRAGADVLAGLTESAHGPQHYFGVDSSVNLVRPDPMPYGLQPNREMLASYLRYMKQLELVPGGTRLEDCFWAVDESLDAANRSN